MIRFKIGRDAQGRECAVEAFHHTTHSRIPLGRLFILALLLILPTIAIKQFSPNLRILIGYVTGITILTWVAYYHDKKCAISGRWRVPESTLHLLELFGGWPAAFLAQHCLRHKSSKRSYKFVFWLIVLLNQYAALDLLQHGKFTSAALSFAIKHLRTQK